jgi:hypothetical protein
MSYLLFPGRQLVNTRFQESHLRRVFAAASRVYVNPWIIRNGYESHVSPLNTKNEALPWPPTNMVLFAGKPLT